jgi:hypothetical protein
MSMNKITGIVGGRERPARMRKLLIGALLVLSTIGGTVALATPQAQAATPAARPCGTDGEMRQPGST